tara:strand:- start:2166 stop:2921 length:756 start_codon:yes stop_codon:yes gene_type:complete
MKIFLIFFLLICSTIQSREVGQTEITTEEGIEVYQKEKYYLLKKNVFIDSDNFTLKAEKVKAFFEKDLYDIVEIFSIGNVSLESNNDLKVLGNEVDYNVIEESIDIRGKNCFFQNSKFTMISDKNISVNNTTGFFDLYGNNAKLEGNNIIIIGEKINGKFTNIDGQNAIENLDAEDKEELNIKTETLDMYSLKAKFNSMENTIELFDNVKIIRDNELILGDYAIINTLDESYKIKSNESKRVKVLLEKQDE